MKRLVLLTLLLIRIASATSFAQSIQNNNSLRFNAGSDETNETAIVPDFVLFFRANKSDIDPTYMNNAAVLNQMNRIVNEENIAYIDSLIISAMPRPKDLLSTTKGCQSSVQMR